MLTINEQMQKKLGERYVKIIDELGEKIEKGIELTDTEACLFVLGHQYKYALTSIDLILNEILPKIEAALDANREILEALEQVNDIDLESVNGSQFIN